MRRIDRVLPLLDEVLHRLNCDIGLSRAGRRHHEGIDPRGEVVDRGSLEIVNDEGTSSTVIAQAAAIVRLDV